MRLSIGVLSISLLACATHGPPDRPWVRVQTPHFELISSADEERSREIAEGLELFRAVLEVVTDAATLEPRIPTLVYVFGDPEGFARFRVRARVAGFMAQRPHRNFLVIDASREDQALATAYHEFVHFVLRNGAAVRYPTWYDEGFAEFLSTVELDGGEVAVGRIPEERGRWLLYGSLLGLDRIMTAENVLEWSDRALARFYAQSWALTHFLYVGHAREFPRLYHKVGPYIRHLNRGASAEEASELAFRMDIPSLEKHFVRYVGEGQMPYFRLPLSRLPERGEVKVAPLPPQERGYLLGDLALALGPSWQGEAELWLGHAAALEPPDARVQAALGLALARRGAPEFDLHLSRAQQLAPDDPEVVRLCGEAWLERALALEVGPDALRMRDEARRHLRRSLELDPEQVAAHAVLGRSYLVGPPEDGAREGMQALETARERLPADRSISFWLAQLELLVGTEERARELLARLPPPSHGDPSAGIRPAELSGALQRVGLASQRPERVRHLESRLDLDAPAAGARVRSLAGLVGVSGRSGFWESKLHDVVVAIDQSNSTLHPTGTDLDGDGKVGVSRTRHFSSRLKDYSSDPGDAVIQAELEAARVLIRRLDPHTMRVAVVAFAGRTEVLAPLGTPAAALEALEGYRIRVDPTGTSLALALTASLEAFLEGRDLESRRQRTILLLSDGQPTVPTIEIGRHNALELAEQLGEFGVPVHAYAIGAHAIGQPGFYKVLAELSGGPFIPVENPEDVVSHFAEVRFTGLEGVEIRNLTTGEEARAVRVFPDGTFDGYAPLAPGENEIEVTAHLDGAASLSESRRVFFERPQEPGPEERAAALELRAELERRSVELDLLNEIRARRRGAQTRELELEAEPVPAGD